MTSIEIINLLRLAIELAGDGGLAPFTSEEYDEMNNFFKSIRK